MQDIKKFKNIFPLYTDRIQIRMLKISDIDWYIDNMRSEYYNKYIDCNFMLDFTEDKLRKRIYKIVKEYNLSINSSNELRLIAMDSDINEPIGGCVLHIKDDTMTIAYFIIPDRQNKGYAYEMMREVIEKIAYKYENFKRFRALVQDRNIPSIKLLNKLGFEKTDNIKGKYTINEIYTIERSYICKLENTVH